MTRVRDRTMAVVELLAAAGELVAICAASPLFHASRRPHDPPNLLAAE